MAWSMWLSIAIIFCWASKALFLKRPSSKLDTWLTNITLVGVPHIWTVMISHIYYIASNPTDGFVNKEACSTLWRAAFAKEITSNQEVTNFYLAVAVNSNVTNHFLYAPLMLILLLSGEIKYDSWIPYSTIFIIFLGLIVGVSQIFGSRICCGDIWFNV